MKELEKPTIEKLEELEKQTKDKFTKKLIDDLKKQIKFANEPEMFKILNFERILKLIKHEDKRDKLNEFKKNKYRNVAYNLKISLRGKKRNLILNGEFLLSELSSMIQKEFDLEPMHLYEFQIGKYKFGPECDEWQEIFDSFDDYKLGSAISIAELNKGNKFRFLYDFGDKTLFNIEIVDIKKLDLGVLK
ncbi:hypothetical protein HYT23_05155 [Candidatus Pacearchaeota archaeon]|nr:hypothetical protein [Candidatus Pacearchaeota archaeon]